MFKKIIIGIFLILSLFMIYFQHSAVYDSSNINLFGIKFDVSNYMNSSYLNYFMHKDENPRYVWNNEVFKGYTQHCHEKGINCIVFPHQQFYTDLIWIGSIQYIGSVIDSLSAKYLYNLLDNLTTLTPYWDYPYIFGELMLPANKALLRQVDRNLLEKTWNDGVAIGEKGKRYNCNPFKQFLISGLNNENYYTEIYSKPLKHYYLNPCDSGDIPGYLGFNYFYFLGNYTQSAENYKLASFNEDSPGVYPSMYGIVQGKGGNHEKTLQIWFAKFLSFQEQLKSANSKESIDFYNEQAIDSLKKGVYELQLSIIQDADQKVYSDSNCYHKYECLESKGLIKLSLSSVLSGCINTQVDDSLFLGKANITPEKKQQYYNNVKCIVTSYGIQNNYIDIKNYSLNYPFKDKLGNNISFGWDNDFNEWKVIKK